MNATDQIIALITSVATEARETSASKTIELTAVRDLCLDRARHQYPDLVQVLSTVRGLVAVSVTLSQLPQIVTAVDVRGTVWTFVPTAH